MHGLGTATWADGSKSEGSWEDDKLNGYAITYYADGSINQKGIFKDDKFLSEQALADCIGKWSSINWNNCFGTFEYGTGDKYIGEFKDGMYYGQGTYVYGINTQWAGYQYIGKFANNQRNGKGVLTYPSGDKYIGEFKNDKFNGQGTFTYGINTEWAGHRYTGYSVSYTHLTLPTKRIV